MIYINVIISTASNWLFTFFATLTIVTKVLEYLNNLSTRSNWKIRNNRNMRNIPTIVFPGNKKTITGVMDNKSIIAIGEIAYATYEI